MTLLLFRIREFLQKRQQLYLDYSYKKEEEGFHTSLFNLTHYKQNSFFNLCTVLTLTPSSLDIIFTG